MKLFRVVRTPMSGVLSRLGSLVQEEDLVGVCVRQLANDSELHIQNRLALGVRRVDVLQLHLGRLRTFACVGEERNSNELKLVGEGFEGFKDFLPSERDKREMERLNERLSESARTWANELEVVHAVLLQLE